MAAINRHQPAEISHQLTGHLILCSFTTCVGRETRLAGSRIRTVDAHAGSCEIVPAGADYWARWHNHKEVAVFSVESDWLSKIAQQEVGATRLELEVDALPFVSDRIRQIAQMLRSEFMQPHHEPSSLYTDSLLTLLGMELIRNHSSAAARPERRQRRMPKKTIDKVTQYMRSEIGTAITVESLADVVGYSANHFLKCFKAETGQTPHKFLVNLRLDLAQELLTTTKSSITDIAFKAGFSSQTHLTSAMTKERSVTPGQLRRGLVLDQ